MAILRQEEAVRRLTEEEDKSELQKQELIVAQQKLNQLAQAQQQAYQLPMTRIQDVSNIYGGIAGSIPGSPTMPFQPSPMVTGIGAGLGAANIMGMFAQQNTQQTPQYTNPTSYTGGLMQDYYRNPTNVT